MLSNIAPGPAHLAPTRRGHSPPPAIDFVKAIGCLHSRIARFLVSGGCFDDPSSRIYSGPSPGISSQREVRGSASAQAFLWYQYCICQQRPGSNGLAAVAQQPKSNVFEVALVCLSWFKDRDRRLHPAPAYHGSKISRIAASLTLCATLRARHTCSPTPRCSLCLPSSSSPTPPAYSIQWPSNRAN